MIIGILVWIAFLVAMPVITLAITVLVVIFGLDYIVKEVSPEKH